jgi:hypothetical protein
MHCKALVVVLAASVMAVEDPAAKVEKGKATKNFLKEDLGDLKGSQIEALGTTNSEICALIEAAHVEEMADKEKFQDRMRRRLNFNCALAIQKNHPGAFSEIFYEASKGEKMEFVRRMGEQICAHQSVFQSSPIEKQVGKYCTKAKNSQQQSASATAPNTKNDNSSALALQISLATICGAALVALFI